MKLLNQARMIAGIKVDVLADYLNIPYVTLGKILKEDIPCSEEIKNKIKFFLIKNYTERIEKL